MRTVRTLLSLGLAAEAAATSIQVTPHDAFSSSIGVLGCKINTDRVAYWPSSVGCDNICVKLTAGSLSVHLLRIDQSAGAHDISYDAWVYLQSGKTASSNPLTGNTVDVEYEDVDASECADLIKTPDHKLPLSASNSMNYVTACTQEPNSWVAKNHVLYNICDSACTLGFDEVCTLNPSVSNQASCPHTLGMQSKLTTAPVIDTKYQTGKTVVAGSGQEVSPPQQLASDGVFKETSASTASQSTTTLPTSSKEAPQPATTSTPAWSEAKVPEKLVAPPPSATTIEETSSAATTTTTATQSSTDISSSLSQVPTTTSSQVIFSSNSTALAGTAGPSGGISTTLATAARPTGSSGSNTGSGTSPSSTGTKTNNAGQVAPLMALIFGTALLSAAFASI